MAPQIIIPLLLVGAGIWAVHEEMEDGDVFKRAPQVPTQDAIVQLDGGDLRLGDLSRLSGLQGNVTGDDGSTVFSSEILGDMVGKVEKQDKQSHDGLRRGRLAFAIPGLEEQVKGTWITVSMSEEAGDEAVKAFNELYQGLKMREQVAGEAKDVVDAYMRLRQEA